MSQPLDLQQYQLDFNDQLCSFQNYLLDQPQDQQMKLLQLFADLYQIVEKDQQFSIKLEEFVVNYKKPQMQSNKQETQNKSNLKPRQEVQQQSKIQNIQQSQNHKSTQNLEIIQISNALPEQNKQMKSNDSYNTPGQYKAPSQYPQQLQPNDQNNTNQDTRQEFQQKSENIQQQQINHKDPKKQFEEIITNLDSDISTKLIAYFDVTFWFEQQLLFKPEITDITIFNTGDNQIWFTLELVNEYNNNIAFDQKETYLYDKIYKDKQISIQMNQSTLIINNSGKEPQQQKFQFCNQDNNSKIMLGIKFMKHYKDQIKQMQMQMQSSQFFQYQAVKDIFHASKPSIPDTKLHKQYEISRIQQPITIPIRIDFKTVNLKFEIIAVLNNFRIGVYNLESESNEIEYDMKGQKWANQNKVGESGFELSINSEIEIKQEKNQIIIYFTPINKTKVIKQEIKELLSLGQNAKMGIYFLIYDENDIIKIVE